jgi:uncharacterized RDD family membrane protein YckC
MNPREISTGDPATESSLPMAGLWRRLAAAIVDFLVLAVALCVFISFYTVLAGVSNQFLDLRPGVASAEVLAKFGPRFIAITLAVWIVVSWLYFAGFESSSWRATLGKRALSIYVTNVSGQRISFGTATVRFVAGRLLLQTPHAGFYYGLADLICIPLTEKRQAIHDKIAGSLVLRKTGYGF